MSKAQAKLQVIKWSAPRPGKPVSHEWKWGMQERLNGSVERRFIRIANLNTLQVVFLEVKLFKRCLKCLIWNLRKPCG
ncbi:hypothetical protein ACTXT7_009853 [Hymenolepis weldensis]